MGLRERTPAFAHLAMFLIRATHEETNLLVEVNLALVRCSSGDSSVSPADGLTLLLINVFALTDGVVRRATWRVSLRARSALYHTIAGLRHEDEQMDLNGCLL